MSNSTLWSIAIFSSRESINVLCQSIKAVITSCGEKTACIHVLVNGNTPLADDLEKSVAEIIYQNNITIRVWSLPVADKAHAWNYYLHSIWQASDMAFFIDGYVRVNSNALKLLSDSLQLSPAATGVPSIGRSAQWQKHYMLTHGGIHGNLFALSAQTMQKLRDMKFRLPLGIYRTDPLIGAVINYNFDPLTNEWHSGRVLVHPEVSWDKDLATWSIKDAIIQIKRMLRQAQGTLENEAIKNHLSINKLSPSLLPETAFELVDVWVKTHQLQAKWLFFKNPLTYIAWRKLQKTGVYQSSVEVSPLCPSVSDNKLGQLSSPVNQQVPLAVRSWCDY